MKILKEGSVKPINLKMWRAQVVCKKDDKYDKEKPCGAELEVSEKDLIVRYYEGAWSDHYYLAARCPLCGKINRARGIPGVIYERVMKRKKRSAAFDGFSDR